MREALEIVADLQARYIDLKEFKNSSCVEVKENGVEFGKISDILSV